MNGYREGKSDMLWKAVQTECNKTTLNATLTCLGWKTFKLKEIVKLNKSRSPNETFWRDDITLTQFGRSCCSFLSRISWISWIC